jgi:4-hydroxy-tetrahydrodipicolinate synthase
MKENRALSGTGVAIITPFDVAGRPDIQALRTLVDHLAENGIDNIVVLGTTGESVTLNETEQRLVVDAVIDQNAGRCAVMVGMGGNNTAALEQKMKTFDFTGIDGILSVSPYYNKPTQEGIFRHYEVLANVAPRPIMLYNVPGRTGANMTAETTLRIAEECKNIAGIKEASGNMEQIMNIIRNKPKNFLVISGDDALTLPILAAGGDGVISVVANAFPQLFSAMVNYCMENRFQDARPIHNSMLEFTRLMFADGSPGGIKASLKVLGICDEFVRLPLVNVRPEIFKAIEHETHILKRMHVKA